MWPYCNSLGLEVIILWSLVHCCILEVIVINKNESRPLSLSSILPPNPCSHHFFFIWRALGLILNHNHLPLIVFFSFSKISDFHVFSAFFRLFCDFFILLLLCLFWFSVFMRFFFVLVRCLFDFGWTDKFWSSAY